MTTNKPTPAAAALAAAVLAAVITPQEAAARLNVTPQTIRRWCDAGRLPHRRAGDAYLIFWPTSDDADQTDPSADQTSAEPRP